MSVVLIGAGAQAKYALETLSLRREVEVIGILDISANPSLHGTKLGGVPVLGDTGLLSRLADEGVDAVLVCSGSPHRKQELTELVQAAGLGLVNAIHPRAVVASTAKLGRGVIVNAGAVIQPFARVEDGVMVHANVVIEHDCHISAYANLAPAVALAGWVRVGRRAIVYTGASVIPGVQIGEDAIVGAGAVVIEDVPASATVVGVPARVVRQGEMEP